MTIKGLPCKNKTQDEIGYCHLHKEQSETRQCQGITAKGERCKRNVLAGHFCHDHRVCKPCKTPATQAKKGKNEETDKEADKEDVKDMRLGGKAFKLDTSGLRDMVEVDGKPMEREHYDRLSRFDDFKKDNGDTYEKYVQSWRIRTGK